MQDTGKAFVGGDASTVLSIYMVLLFAIPSTMIVLALGSAGAPSMIMAVGTFFWWLWYHIQRDRNVSERFQPVRAAMLGWMLLMFVVYAHAISSPIPGDEISPADSGMLKLLGFGGILLVGNDGIASMSRHRTVIRRLVIAVGLIAILGLIQYATQELWIDRLRIPGLTSGNSGLSLASRSGLTRPSGTSTHPIEYGVVLTMVLPLLIVFAVGSPTRRWVYRLFLCAAAFAVFLSISRSALVCAAIGVTVLAASWSFAARLRALAFGVVISLVVYVTTPGVLGTITGLFTGAADDPSIISRTNSFDLAGHFIGNSPWLGRGFGTFLPKYWILDNGYLGLLIEGGLLGFLGLLAVVASAVVCARKAVRLAVDDFDQQVGHALVASIAAGASALAFFDTFGFPQSAGCFFLLLGLAGAYLRLTKATVATISIPNDHSQFLRIRARSGGSVRERARRSLGLRPGTH